MTEQCDVIHCDGEVVLKLNYYDKTTKLCRHHARNPIDEASKILTMNNRCLICKHVYEHSCDVAWSLTEDDVTRRICFDCMKIIPAKELLNVIIQEFGDVGLNHIALKKWLETGKYD